MKMKMGDILMLVGAGFAVIEYTKPGHGIWGGLLAGSAIGTPPATITPPATNPPATTGLTFEQACSQARDAFISMGMPGSREMSCAAIQQHLAGSPSLFVAPHPIRTALGV